MPACRIHLHVSEEEVAARRAAAWRQPARSYPRGDGAHYSQHIGQADESCDFDFLAPLGAIPQPETHEAKWSAGRVSGRQGRPNVTGN